MQATLSLSVCVFLPLAACSTALPKAAPARPLELSCSIGEPVVAATERGAAAATAPLAAATIDAPATFAPAADIDWRVAPAPQAEEKYGPSKGQSILTVGGTIQSNSSEFEGASSQTDVSIAAQAGLGYFVTPEIEVGGQVLGDWNLPDAGGDSVSVFIAPYGNYNYPVDPRFWLYAGPHIGLAFFKGSGGSATDFELGLHGGGRYWVTTRTSLFGELRYTHSELDFDAGTLTLDSTQFLVGFNYVF